MVQIMGIARNEGWVVVGFGGWGVDWFGSRIAENGLWVWTF